MPSAAEVVGDDRVRFVLNARPDLADALRAALRPDLGDDPQARLDTLAREEPQTLGALQLAIVGGYYTDRRVRELIGYPGQMALTLRSWEYPAYLEEGHIDAVLARGPSWRDPATGQRAVATGDEPRHVRRALVGDRRVARRRSRWPRRPLIPRRRRPRAGSTPSSRTGSPAPARRTRSTSPRPAGTC